MEKKKTKIHLQQRERYLTKESQRKNNKKIY